MKNNGWDPILSLNQYFPEDKVSSDEIEILKFISDFLKMGDKHFSRILDFGTGPVIHRLFPFTKYTDKIYIAEYLPESLREIKKWKENRHGSRNWNFYVKKVLEIEKTKSDTSAIEKRKSLLRKKMFRLIKGDIFKTRPLVKPMQFPLVISFYCLDSITRSKKIWYKLMSHLSSLVCKDGWLIISALRNTNYSILGDTKMPNVKLNEKDIRLALEGLGYKTIDIKVINAKIWSGFGILSVMIAKARKS